MPVFHGSASSLSATELLVIRHGESEWNAAGRWQGQEDPPLTALGRRQAQIAAEAIDHRFSLLAASDLQRANETARIIGERIGLDVVTRPALRERHAGAWQGLTRAEIHDGWPGALADGRRPEGFELDDELLDRVLRGLRALVEAVEGPVLTVAHGGVIRALDRSAGAPDESIPNLAGRWYRLGSKLEAGERVEFITSDVALDIE